MKYLLIYNDIHINTEMAPHAHQKVTKLEVYNMYPVTHLYFQKYCQYMRTWYTLHCPIYLPHLVYWKVSYLLRDDQLPKTKKLGC